MTEGVIGMIRNTEVARSNPRDAKSAIKIGDEVNSKVLGIDRKNRKISLSIKALELEEEGRAVQDYGTDPAIHTRSLGAKLKEKFFTSA